MIHLSLLCALRRGFHECGVRFWTRIHIRLYYDGCSVVFLATNRCFWCELHAEYQKRYKCYPVAFFVSNNSYSPKAATEIKSKSFNVKVYFPLQKKFKNTSGLFSK